jgi:hypothetical protein
MRSSRRLNLTAKFNILTISLILVTAVSIGAVVIYQDRASSYEELRRHGEMTAAMLARNSEYGIYAEDEQGLRQIVESLRADVDVSYVGLLNAELETLVREVRTPGLELPVPRVSPSWYRSRVSRDRSQKGSSPNRRTKHGKRESSAMSSSG